MMLQHKIVAIMLCCAFLLASCTHLRQSKQAPEVAFPAKPHYIRALPPLDATIQPTEESQAIPESVDETYFEYQLRLDAEMGVPTASVYWTEPNHALQATFFLNNMMLEEYTLTILCLVDYQQVPCQNNQPTLSVTLLPGEHQDVLLEYPELAPGMHQLLAIAALDIPMPTDKATPETLDDFIVTSSGLSWGDDVMVYAGSYAAPVPEWASFPSIPASPNFSGSLNFAITAANLHDLAEGIPHPNMFLADEVLGQVIQVAPGQELNFSLIGTYGDEAMYYQAAREFNLDIDTTGLPFVVTAFIDALAVPIQRDGPAGPMFGKIPRNKSAVVPISFTAPQEPGLYAYFVLYQEDPFVRSGKLMPQQDGGLLYQHYMDLSHIYSTERLVFEVVPDSE